MTQTDESPSSRWRSAGEQARLVREGEVTAGELVAEAIALLESDGAALNVLASERFESARVEAAARLPEGPLTGVPVLLKDVGFGMAGESDYLGSALLKSRDVRAVADVVATGRLRASGAVILGRTTAPEFAIRSTTESVAHGATRNPWSPDHITGGSSGGSCAAVAAGLVPVAQGTDGAGSLRMPASICGVITMKPSRGRISQAPDGAPLLGHSEFGVVTRSMDDLALLMDVLSGPEPGDPHLTPLLPGPFSSFLSPPQRPLRVGIFTGSTLGGVAVDRENVLPVTEAARLLGDLGHTVVESFPEAYDDDEYIDRFIDVVAPGVVALFGYLSAVAGRDIRRDDVEATAWYWYECGLSRSGADLTNDIAWMESYRRRMASWWEQGYDLLLAPSFMRKTPLIGSLEDTTPEVTRQHIDLTRATAPFNSTGEPALTLPISMVDGLPAGVQLVAPLGREDVLVSVGLQLEGVIGWGDRRPGLSS